MVVLTLQFVYRPVDFLLYNPKNNKIDRDQPIKVRIWLPSRGTSYASAKIVGARFVSKLPKHIENYLYVCENNVLSQRPLSDLNDNE